MSSVPVYRRQPSAGVWPVLTRMVVFMAVILALAMLAVLFMPVLRELQRDTARMEELSARLEKERTMLARNQRELDLLKNDPAYIETLARDRLDLMKDGEMIFRIEETPAASAAVRKTD